MEMKYTGLQKLTTCKQTHVVSAGRSHVGVIGHQNCVNSGAPFGDKIWELKFYPKFHKFVRRGEYPELV